MVPLKLVFTSNRITGCQIGYIHRFCAIEMKKKNQNSKSTFQSGKWCNSGSFTSNPSCRGCNVSLSLLLKFIISLWTLHFSSRGKLTSDSMFNFSSGYVAPWSGRFYSLYDTGWELFLTIVMLWERRKFKRNEQSTI